MRLLVSRKLVNAFAMSGLDFLLLLVFAGSVKQPIRPEYYLRLCQSAHGSRTTAVLYVPET